jgi:hypothetical protein
MFFMLVVNLDSLKQSVSVWNWSEIHGAEKNSFTGLIWIKFLTQGNTAEWLLWLLSYLFVHQISTLQTETENVFQEFSRKNGTFYPRYYIYVKKDWITSHDLSPSFFNSSSIVLSFRKGSANPKNERYLVFFIIQTILLYIIRKQFLFIHYRFLLFKTCFSIYGDFL